MSTDNLPPTLAVAFAALTDDLGVIQRTRLIGELQAISDLIGQARIDGILIPDILDHMHARAGITVGPDKVCSQCLRPF